MPYTTSTSDGKVTVSKKVGGHTKVVGHTTPAKKDKYLAALHIHSKDKDKKNENMEFDNQIGDIYAVSRPHDGCEVGKMVHKVDPMVGIQNLEPQQVHGFYPDEDSAMGVAQGLYEDHIKAAQMLEEKKGKVGDKIKKAIDQLEKKRKEHIDMAKEDPKSAAQHKEHIAHLATKIDDLMTKLEKIEKSKKEIKKDEDKKKKTLKESKFTAEMGKTKSGDTTVIVKKDGVVLSFDELDKLSDAEKKEIAKLKADAVEAGRWKSKTNNIFNKK